MPKSDRCSLPWSREFDDPIPLPDGSQLGTPCATAGLVTALRTRKPPSCPSGFVNFVQITLRPLSRREVVIDA
jgi:hypothetical protein